MSANALVKQVISADDPEVTVERAAEILGVSPPVVARLIDHGDIPARLEGARRLIAMAGLIAYRERREAFAEFTALGEEMFLKHGV